MNREFKRTDRVAELILRTLSQIIQREVSDPRLPSLITISSVQVSPDLGHAKIYFTALSGDNKLTASILNEAVVYLRKALARTVKLRIIPQLHFIYDESIEYSERLRRLIDKANPPSDPTD